MVEYLQVPCNHLFLGRNCTQLTLCGNSNLMHSKVENFTVVVGTREMSLEPIGVLQVN